VTQEKAGLGEQALNKIAEMALSNQMEEVERLEVHVKTNPSQLAHGEVESIAIKGEGLMMQPDLSVAELELHINRVTVKPLSALFGKIELTQPTDGTARIVINEENLNRAFNSESFHKQLQQRQVFVENKQMKIDAQQMKCDLLANGKIAINGELIVGETGKAQLVTFTAIPQIGADRQAIILQDVQYSEGKELSPELTAAIVAQVSEVLNLSNFELEGMSLRIQQVNVTAGKLVLQAAAKIEQFPSS